MESCEIKNCRLCNKEGFIFCGLDHEVIQKFIKFIPNMVNVKDESLLHITKVCTTCYKTVKTIVFNIENIMDTQKILKIENSMRHHRPIKIEESAKKDESVKKEENHQIVHDITRKYSNIKLKKVSICSTNSASPGPSPVPVILHKKEEKSPSEGPPRKIVVVEALPEPVESPRKNRSLMCITCSQKFTDYDQMQEHLKTCKASPNNLKCFCGKVLNSKKDLAVHVYSQHKNNKQNHACTICHKLFSSLFNLQNHIAMNHSTLEQKAKFKGTFLCQYCKGKFLTAEELNKHREVEKCGAKKFIET